MVLSYLRYLWGIFWRLWVFFGYLRARARSGGPGPVPRHLFPGLFFGYPAPPGPDLFFGYLWAIFDFLWFLGLCQDPHIATQGDPKVSQKRSQTSFAMCVT